MAENRIPLANVSFVATGTSNPVLGINNARFGLFFKNDTAVDVWLNFEIGGTAAAVAGSGNVKLPANGGYLELPATSRHTGPVHAKSAGADAAVTCYEW